MLCSTLIRVLRQLSSLYDDQMGSSGIQKAQEFIRCVCSKLQTHPLLLKSCHVKFKTDPLMRRTEHFLLQFTRKFAYEKREKTLPSHYIRFRGSKLINMQKNSSMDSECMNFSALFWIYVNLSESSLAILKLVTGKG